MGAAPLPDDEDAADEEDAAAAVLVPLPVPVVVALDVPLPLDAPPVAQAFAGIVAAEYVCELAARAELQATFEAFCNSEIALAPLPSSFVNSSIDVRSSSAAVQALVSQRHLITVLWITFAPDVH